MSAVGRRHRRRMWFVLAGVVGSAALVAVAVTAVGHWSGSAGQPTVLVAPSAVVLVADGPSEPGPPPAPTEERAPSYEQVLGLASLGGTLVAIGERAARPRDQEPELSMPLAWWSVDGGERWEPAAMGDIANGTLAGVAADRDRFVAVGSRLTPRGPVAIVLVSSDGRSWTEELIDGADVALQTVVATPGGTVLAGSRNDLSGLAPVVFVPEKDGWRQVVLLGQANGSEGEVRGACAAGREIVLVGRVRHEGESGTLVLRSTDGGRNWRPVGLPGPALVGTDARANACATAGGRTAVTGTATVRGYDRAFVSVGRDDRWQDAFLLEPSSLQRQGHTLARTTVVVGAEFAVLGYDSSTDNGDGDLAAWQSRSGGWIRLDALDTLGAGFGVAEARATILDRGVLIVGGTSSDRAVVWRVSPAAAVTPPSLTSTTLSTWWARHGDDDPCRLTPAVAIEAALGPIPVATPRLLPEPAGPTVSCTWLRENGDTAVQIQLAPADRFERLAANYPPELRAPTVVDGVCEAGAYYPDFVTLVARCDDTAVAVAGLPQDIATILMKAFIKELAD